MECSSRNPNTANIKKQDVGHTLPVKSRFRLLRTARHVRRRQRRRRRFGKAAPSPHFLISNTVPGSIMRIQFTVLRECLVIDQFMKHLTGGSKEQRPPVGKSSDTPKEVKIARREELPPVIGKPADMGRDAFICKHAYPVICRKNHVQYVWNNFRKIIRIFVSRVI